MDYLSYRCYISFILNEVFMPFSFLSLSDQVELNQKRIEFEYERYETYTSRFAYLSILYSVLFFFFIQLLNSCFFKCHGFQWIYFPFALYVLLLSYSVYESIQSILPRVVYFVDLPKKYYEEIRNQYVANGITDEDELDQYLLASYNSQLEVVLEKNEEINIAKAGHYVRAFRSALACFLPYLICTVYYLSNVQTESQVFELKNYKEIGKYIDTSFAHYTITSKSINFDTVNKKGYENSK